MKREMESEDFVSSDWEESSDEEEDREAPQIGRVCELINPESMVGRTILRTGYIYRLEDTNGYYYYGSNVPEQHQPGIYPKLCEELHFLVVCFVLPGSFHALWSQLEVT